MNYQWDLSGFNNDLWSCLAVWVGAEFLFEANFDIILYFELENGKDLEDSCLFS